MVLYPILLEPVCKEYLWGGNRLITKYDKKCAFETRTLAESWELSVHEEGSSGVANGVYAGKTMREFLRENPQALGSRARDGLPLLIKYIDAAQELSVQVHPDDAYAREHHGEPGKTEFWYIMDSEPGASLYYGLKEPLERGEFIQRARDGSIVQMLNRVEVFPGDIFLIPPGLVHAIGRGMTVAEIGTNCNITYRIYDYGRTDVTGNPRPLHVEQAADVYRPDTPRAQWREGSVDCGPFLVTKLELNGIMDIQPDESSFQCLLCVWGKCMVDRAAELNAGGSVFISAGTGYTLRGNATLLVVTV